MNKEDIIRMAREANIKQAIETPHLLMVHELERFATLVAAHERESCAKVCDEREEIFRKYYTTGLPALCASAIRARGQA
jgi:hypothetical protein